MAKYDSNLPYDYPVSYDEGGVHILVPAEPTVSLRPEPNPSAGGSVFVPEKHSESEEASFNPSSGQSAEVPLATSTMVSGAGYFKVEIIAFTGAPVPLEHIEDAQKLEADAEIELFQIILSDRVSKLYLKMNSSAEWQGNTYEGTGIKLDGVAKYADDETSRPKLSLFNPDGVYSYAVDQGLLDGAVVARYRVLKKHLDEDVPTSRRQQWKVSRVASVRSGVIGLELRDMLDGQNFLVPARMFIPPDFPTVSLS